MSYPFYYPIATGEKLTRDALLHIATDRMAVAEILRRYGRSESDTWLVNRLVDDSHHILVAATIVDNAEEAGQDYEHDTPKDALALASTIRRAVDGVVVEECGLVAGAAGLAELAASLEAMLNRIWEDEAHSA